MGQKYCSKSHQGAMTTQEGRHLAQLESRTLGALGLASEVPAKLGNADTHSSFLQTAELPMAGRMTALGGGHGTMRLPGFHTQGSLRTVPSLASILHENPELKPRGRLGRGCVV